MFIESCDWPLCDESPSESPSDVCLACCTSIAGADPEIVQRAISRASEMMRRLSGYNVGQCVAELRPLTTCSECRSSCCGGSDGIRLEGPNGEPVAEVLEVMVGATVVDESTYRFDVEKQMLWTVPPARWPKRDDRWADCGTEGAFCITALVGNEPDAWALKVARELACELVKSCTPGQKCRIPRNATQVVGQGITVTLSDRDFKVLLPEVGGWVEAVNPYNAVLPAKVFSPENRGGRSTRGDRGPWWHR
jgi:hypothetical protein